MEKIKNWTARNRIARSKSDCSRDEKFEGHEGKIKDPAFLLNKIEVYVGQGIVLPSWERSHIP